MTNSASLSMINQEPLVPRSIKSSFHNFDKIFLLKGNSSRPSYAELYYERQGEIINKALQKLLQQKLKPQIFKVYAQTITESKQTRVDVVVPIPELIKTPKIPKIKLDLQIITNRQTYSKQELDKNDITIMPYNSNRSKKSKKIKLKPIQDRFKAVMNYNMESFTSNLHKELIGMNYERQNDKRFTYQRSDYTK